MTLLVHAGYADHFPMPDTATGNTMSVIIRTAIAPTLDGVPLNKNDEIALCDSAGNCFGYGTWDSVHNINVITYGDDPMLAGKQGFYGGDAVKVIIWDTVAQREVVASAGAGKNGLVYNRDAIYILTSLTAISPAAPLPLSPADGGVGQSAATAFTWETVSGASSYSLQVAADSAFSSILFSRSGITGTAEASGSLAVAKAYYWHVSANTAGGTGLWSDVRSFSVPQSLTIPLVAGWNLVSLNVNPLDSGVGAVFGTSGSTSPQNASQEFILVKDLAGDIYWPLYNNDGIDTLHAGQGYLVYSDSADTVRAQGTPVDVAAASIQLAAGWNMIGYLPQTGAPVSTALAGIESQIYIVKNNSGRIYWPEFGIDDIDTLYPGSGYLVDMRVAAVLTYPQGVSKASAGSRPLLALPVPRHFPLHANTGNNATVLAHGVTVNGGTVADGSELGAFDGRGNCVGSGTVVHGTSAFAVWGDDPMTKQRDGCADGEVLVFRLWEGGSEYPLACRPDGAAAARYAANGIIAGVFSATATVGAAGFDLPKAYPNPFHGAVNIAFDVPSSGSQALPLEIGVYDVKGCLVQQLARGAYKGGHYSLSWSPSSEIRSVAGSEVYFIRMKTQNFDKQVKLVRVR